MTKDEGGDEEKKKENKKEKKDKNTEAKIRTINMARKVDHCPRCGELSMRRALGSRTLHEVGIDGPRKLVVTFSRHYCKTCRKQFSQPMDHLALPQSRFTNRVRRTAVDLVIKQALTLKNATERMKTKYHVHVPPTTLHGWVVAELTLDMW